MNLSWYGITKKADGIMFEDMGCGCCSYSPTFKGKEALTTAREWVKELEEVLLETKAIIAELEVSVMTS